MLIATVGALAMLALYLVIDGEQMRSSYHAFTSCRPVDTAACQYKFQVFHDDYGSTGFIGVMLTFLPSIIGSFAGAPLLARELETGTFRYAWTQSAGRMRWAAAVLVSGAVGVATVTAAFGALVTWHNQPLRNSGITPRLHTTVFPETGVAAAGWALIGFALGVLAGLLWRRVVPAIVTAFAACFGLAFLAATYRLHYVTPLTTTSLNRQGHRPPHRRVVDQTRRTRQRRPTEHGPARGRRPVQLRRRQGHRSPLPAHPPTTSTPCSTCSITATSRSPAPTRQPLLGLPRHRVRLAHRPRDHPARDHVLAPAPTACVTTASTLLDRPMATYCFL